MTDTKQPEALRLADDVDEVARTYPDMAEVSAELRRQHAENTTLKLGYAAARLEIESLRAAQPAGAQQPGTAYAAAAAILEVIAQEPPINGSHLAQARVLMVAGRLRASHGQAPAQDGIEYVRADSSMRAAHPACKPDMLVNGGALKLALNVLRRAGKDEVADELEKTAQPAPQQEAPAMPSDADIDAFLDSPGNINWVIADKRERYRLLVRAVLANWAAPQPSPAAVAGPVPSGWRFDVKRSDGRVWLTISTPHGASATLSAAEKTGNGDDTIVAQVLAYLADSLAAPAAVAGPSEADLPDVEDMAHSAVQEAMSFGVSHDVFHRWMRAVMDKTVAAILAAAPITQPAPQADSQPAPAVGTIAHVGTGKTTLTGAIASALRAARAAHPACKPDMLVNGGALKLALNVLRRAGKHEVADELEKTAQPAPAAVVGPSDSAIPGRLGYSALMRLADENGLGPNNVSGKLQARIELYGRAVERAAIRAQQQLAAAPTTQAAPQQEAQEPVAVIGAGFTIFWAGHGPIAPIVERHALKVGSPLYAAPQPSPAAQGDALDAARYRWLRRWKGQEHEPPFTVQHEIDGTLWGGDLDAAIDAAMKAGGAR